ncbi:MAG TPA: sulfite exporter TauE/SafE family protein [Patescibacteria group bacterium]|nr:sulfite exporter TauE/SafE family protein [Patescibacteria group bacterium]
MGNTNLFAIFLTGLITGGLTCMAVQGGLLAATLAQSEEERLEDKARGGNALPIVAFLIAKLIAYTALGFLLGMLGSFFNLSIQTRVILMVAVAVFMVGTALNILEVHPIFRYFIIQPPRFLTRLVRKQSKSQAMFAPALLGAFTVFIPCGTTQAMMALAIASGKPILGAAILFSFVLGTSPVFFILGYFATKLGDMFQQGFMQLAAFAIILLAIFNINSAIALSGSSWTIGSVIGNAATSFWCTVSFCSPSYYQAQQAGNPLSDATINITSVGYTPSLFAVKAGSKVTLHLQNTNGAGCQQAFNIPSLGIQKIVPVGSSDTISFTAPSQPQQLAFVCSMGMYRGAIQVL